MIAHFLDLAREAGCRDAGALEAVLSQSGGQRSPVLAVLESRLVEEEPFLHRLAEGLGLAWWDGRHAWDDATARALRRAVPSEVALKHHLLPLHLETGEQGGLLHLATYDPCDLVRNGIAARLPGAMVRWQVATRASVAEGLQSLYGVGAEAFDSILRDDPDGGGEDFDLEETMILDDTGEAEASVVTFVNQILRGALEQLATDIHLEPMADQLRIRYRMDGMLQEVPVPENIKAHQASVISRLKIMARLDIAEKRLPQDGRMALELDGRSIDVRVATIPSVEGESISLRLLGQETFSLNRLGLNAPLQRTVDRLLGLPNGIVLVTGPTGSGKSTTLYSFLSRINTSERRIVTIEDPVENKLPGVVQIAVKPDIGLTFARGLRSILRGDPNVVMVGEMRDLETTEIAIRAALTGHLVFSTLHTNDAVSGITRLADMGVERFLIGSAVRAFMAQRLVRRLCPKCRVPQTMEAEDLRALGYPAKSEHTIFVPGGCPSCRGSGFQGRLAIYEICLVTPALRHLISTGADEAALRQQAARDGFVSMRAYGIEKALAGETSVHEVVSATLSEGLEPDRDHDNGNEFSSAESWQATNTPPTARMAL